MSIKDNMSGEFERGKPWNPRKNPDDPNPLYAEAVSWSRGKTAHGDADFLNVRDDDGTLWSILVGTYRLKKELLEGEISEWDDERKAFAVIDVIGRVQPGEMLAIEFRGERQFENAEGRTVTSPDYRTLRKRPPETAQLAGEDPGPPKDPADPGPAVDLSADEPRPDEDIPF